VFFFLYSFIPYNYIQVKVSSRTGIGGRGCAVSPQGIASRYGSHLGCSFSPLVVGATQRSQYARCVGCRRFPIRFPQQHKGHKSFWPNSCPGGLHEYLAVIAKAATFKEDMLSVLDNATAALWATVLRVVPEALKEASAAAVSTQRLREVKIHLAVLPI